MTRSKARSAVRKQQWTKPLPRRPRPGVDPSAPLWAQLGYASEADYNALANAVDCHTCGLPLPKFDRWRIVPPLEAPPGGWLNRWRQQQAEDSHRTGESDLMVCGKCKRILDLGGYPVRQDSAEVLQQHLFD